MIAVAVFNGHPRHKVRHDTVRRYVEGVLRREGRRAADVSVVFVSDRFIRRVNRRFLARDRFTDVISFLLGGGERLEGEIYISLDRARRQAAEYNVSLSDEVARLVIHGTLHLAGYDDSTPHAARRMRAREDAAHGDLYLRRMTRRHR